MWIFWLILDCIWGQMIPSFGVSVCINGEPCVNKLLVTVFVSEASNGNYELDIILPTNRLFVDSTGYSYSLSEPVAITLRWTNLRFTYTLMPVGKSFNSVYETVGTPPYTPICPANSLCCPSNFVRTLRTDPVAYTAYTLPDLPTLSYNMNLHISQGSFSKIVSMNQDISAVYDSGSGIRATIVQTVPDYTIFPSFDGSYFMTSTSGNFLVPQAVFCPSQLSPQCIGMDFATYRFYTRCSDPVNLITTVYGSSTTDQWSQFRNQKIEDSISNCVINSTLSSLTASPPYISLGCSTKTEITVLLELHANSFQIKRLYGVPYITNAGLFPIIAGNSKLNLFLDLSNTGNYLGVFQIIISSCCHLLSCIMVNINRYASIEPFETVRTVATISSPIGSLYNLRLECSLQVLQFGESYLVTQIYLNSTVSTVSPLTVSPTGSISGSCIPPLVLWKPGNIPHCLTPCSIDEVFNNAYGICDPVVCTQKYSLKPYFDLISHVCVPKLICKLNQIYNALKNTCVDSNIAPNSTISPSNKPGGITQSPPKFPIPSQVVPKFVLPNCTGNGYLDPKTNLSCICLPGWLTSSAQDPFGGMYLWCSVSIPVVETAWNNQPASTSTMIIMIAATLAIILLLSGIFFGIQKVFKSRGFKDLANTAVINSDSACRNSNVEVVSKLSLKSVSSVSRNSLTTPKPKLGLQSRHHFKIRKYRARI